MGNGKVKELIYTPHEYELRRGNAEALGVQGRWGIKGENWENCNTMINKIYLKIISSIIG